MMREVADPYGDSARRPTGSRAKVAAFVEGVPFWMCVALLTCLDLVLFGWQMLPWVTEGTIAALDLAELGISTLFIGEVALRCYAFDRAELLRPENVLDNVIVVAAFIGALIDLSAPFLALRGVRLCRYACRISRVANKASRSVEMRAFIGDRPTAAGRAARRARSNEDEVAPLFLDVAKAADVDRAVNLALGAAKKRKKKKKVSEDDGSLLPCVVGLPRAARELLEKAAARAFDAKVAAQALCDAAAQAPAPPGSRTNSPRLESPKKQSPSDKKGRKPAKNPLHDAEAPPPPPPEKALLPADLDACTSVEGAAALLRHAIADAKQRGQPTPRLAALLRGGKAKLLFLNREI